jgi:hypothetical protein
MTRTSRALSWSLVALAGALAANSVLGPLVTDTIRYRYGRAMINQAIGLDAVALVFAAPLAIVAALLVRRSHRAGPVLALAPSTFAIYMMPQYVIGPDYLGLSGNNERAIPFHIATMVLALAVAIMAWRAVGDEVLPPDSKHSDLIRSWVLAGLALFVAVGRWLPGMVDALGDSPSSTYRDNPTAFWLVGLLDLGLVVPAAVTAAIALGRNMRWARKASYAVIAWFSLVPVSIASMAVTMQIDDDPLASNANTVVMTVVGVVFTAAALVLIRPLFARDRHVTPPSERRRPNPAMRGRGTRPRSARIAHSTVRRV